MAQQFVYHMEGVSKAFGAKTIVKNFTGTVLRGDKVGLIGPNGAGKTTFMDIVTGKTRPDAGDVKWGTPPKSLLKMNEAQIARAGIGRKFQRPTVFEDQTVAENLTMALKAARGPFSVLWWKPSADSVARVAELAAEVGLADQLSRKSGELSHGQKQWLEIGMLLAQEPRLLLVDEPAAGMTLAEREQTTTLLRRLAQRHAVVVVEHDMDFVRRLECKVTVLHEGSVLAEGSLDHVTANPQVVEVYLGRG